jgi:predicted HTH transcriptional regulator
MDIKTIILQIINRGYETEIVEFKEAKNQFDFNKLGKYFSALSNEANLHNKKKAWLIFGIRDTDKTFINTNFRRNQKNLHGLKAEIANHTTNRITFIDIHEFTEQGNRIVAFEIPAAPQGFPVAWKGHYFGRDGAELQALNIEEIERIRTQASQSDWSAQIIPEDYIAGEKTPEKYRNPWLVNAMVNLGMIDTMGYGIHTMYLSQKKRFFPLPDYLLTETQKVVLQIYGHSIDENYSKLLIERKDLPLSSVFLLDRVQKNLSISKDAAALLRKEKLIEGRYPNYFVSASVAEVTGDKASYIKNKAFDKTYYKDLIIKFIKRYKKASREDIDALLMGKLSDALNDKQKRTKIRNLLYEMSKKDQSIFNNSKSTNKPEWKLR